jgi:hypothetical protein
MLVAVTIDRHALNQLHDHADLSREQATCSVVPPVRQGTNCRDPVVSRYSGSARTGYPLAENITFHNSHKGPATVTVQVSELTSQQDLPAELFDVPAGYRQVNSVAELNGAPQGSQPAGGAGAGQSALVDQAMHSPNPAARASAGQQGVWQTVAQYGLPVGPVMNAPGGGASPMQGMPGMGAPQAASAPVAAPQALGPKAPGKIRIGVAPPEAQVGQGSNAGADYSTPIRNSIVLLMSGPAVEIAALDSRIAMQLQAEVQQKQCDYILYSSVAVKHSSGSGLGKFMKMAAPIAAMTPVGLVAGGMAGAVAAQAASAAAMSAQQQAVNQLAGFNGQIKSKDDVTVRYQLVPAGQTSAQLQNSLQAKAKSDGEDVLTPLLLQAATAVLTEVSKK